MLYDLAVSAGARVDFAVDVVSVEPGDPNPQVTSVTGQIFTADIVIGADGPRSVVRRTAFNTGDDLVPAGVVVYSGTIPGNKLMRDPVLAPLIKADNVSSLFRLAPFPLIAGSVAHLHGNEQEFLL